MGEGIDFFFGGRANVTVAPLSDEELEAIDQALSTNITVLSAISPRLGVEFKNQMSAFVKWAQIAKGMFPTSAKPITYPSQPGTIGIGFIFPEAIIYPGLSSPYPTSYQKDSWLINDTAGTNSYLFGSSSAFYTTSSTNDTGPGTGHELMVIMQDGLIEVNTTPKEIQQFRILTTSSSKYGIYTVEPLEDISVEPGKAIYQYPTIGQIPLWFDIGTKWYYMPTVSGVNSLRLLGVVFYEHDLFADTTYV